MGAMGRLGLDQFVFAPVFIGTFLSSLLSLEHVSGNDAETALQKKIQTKLQTDWWPAVCGLFLGGNHVSPLPLQLKSIDV
jgi:hypothetical protein